MVGRLILDQRAGVQFPIGVQGEKSLWSNLSRKQRESLVAMAVAKILGIIAIVSLFLVPWVAVFAIGAELGLIVAVVYGALEEAARAGWISIEKMYETPPSFSG